MRFYAIKVSGANSPIGLGSISGAANIINAGTALAGLSDTAIPTLVSSNPYGAQWISVVNGQNDPGALDVDFDITVTSGAPVGSLTIKGITPGDISQVTYLTGARIQVFAGFTEGLPLANMQVPHQGLICDGQIYPAFGNWTGNDLSLTFIIKPGNQSGIGGPTDPKNIVHNLQKNMPLSSALQSALSAAFPNSQFLINIKQSLVLNEPDQGFYQGMEQYMNYIKQLSHSIAGTPSTTGYQGVQAFPVGYGKYVITDFSDPGVPIQLLFEDLIGQPVWIGVDTIQIKTALRADINAAMSAGSNVNVILPASNSVPLLVGIQPGAALGLNTPGWTNFYEHGNQLLFSGSWLVNSIRHVGHYRQHTGTDWVSIIEATSSGFAAGMAAIASTGGIQTFNPSGAAAGSGGGIGMN
jgi:hypothetical protein